MKFEMFDMCYAMCSFQFLTIFKLSESNHDNLQKMKDILFRM